MYIILLFYRLLAVCWADQHVSAGELSEVILYESNCPVTRTHTHTPSSSRHLLVVPRFQLHTYGRRAFAVAGPTTWNSLSVEL